MSLKSTFRLFSASFCLMLIATYCQGQCDQDSIAPTSYTVLLSTALISSETFEVEIYAVDFILFVEDDCTTSDSMRHTFSDIPPYSDPNYHDQYRSSSQIFRCSDLVNSPIEITVYAWDLAGNYTTNSIQMTLVESNGLDCEDCENGTSPPLIEMIPEIIFVASEDSLTVEAWASDFVLSAYDMCTPSDSISYSFTDVHPDQDSATGTMIFDCVDAINSPIELEIYVWDTNGNYTIGNSSINLQFGNTDCIDSFTVVSGTISLMDSSPANEATINLENENGDILYSTKTDENGEYSIFRSPSSKYLTVEYDDGTSPVISALDLFITQRYLLGLIPFSGYQIIAADINFDNRLRVDDMRLMRKFVLGILDINDHLDLKWQFVDQNVDAQSFQNDRNNRIFLNENPNPSLVGYRVGDVK